MDSLKQAQATLSAAVPDLDLSVTTTPSGQHIAFKPKEGTSLTPLSFKFSFDSSEESEQLRRAFNHFHEEGGSLAIPDTAIAGFKFPIPFEVFGPPGSPVIKKLEFEQQPHSLGLFTIEKTYADQTVSIEGVELQIIQSGNTKAKIGTRKHDHRGIELLLEIGRDAGPVSFGFTLQLSNRNAVEAYRAAAFALALSKRGTMKLIQNATGFEFSAASGALPELEIDSKFVELLRRLAIIQVKTKTVLTLSREFSNEDLPGIQKAFLAVTEGKLTTEPFTFTFQPTEEYESALTALRGQIAFKTNNDEIVRILDTPINLGPSEVVADNGLLRIERTDPPSDEAPYGVKHVRLEPVEDSLIYVNYPRFSGVECIPSGS